MSTKAKVAAGAWSEVQGIPCASHKRLGWLFCLHCELVVYIAYDLVHPCSTTFYVYSSLKSTVAAPEHQVTMYSECLTVLVAWMMAFQLTRVEHIWPSAKLDLQTQQNLAAALGMVRPLNAVRGSCKAIT